MKMNTTSPHDNLPILEEGWRCEKDNKVSILKRMEKPSSCNRFLEIAKLILYLELIFFVGWIGCVFLSQTIGNTNYNDSKTERSHAYDPSTIDCTPPNINNQINHKHSMSGVRAKRNSDEDQLKLESCNNTMLSNRKKLNQLTKQFIPGEDSDSNTTMLREICEMQIIKATLNVMMEKLISKTFPIDLTDEQWRAYALDIKELVINSTGEEHHDRIRSSGPPTPETISDLRTTVESMIHNYRDCEKILQFGDASTTPSLADLLNEREKCDKITDTLIEEARPLIVQIIPGDSSDESIMDLRQKVEDMIILTAASITFVAQPTLNFDTMSEKVNNATEEKWRKLIDSIRDDAVNSSSSATREMIETEGPITVEMINDMRTLASNYLNRFRLCDELVTFINKIRGDVEVHLRLRAKRDSVPTSEYGLLKDYLENSKLDMINLSAFMNIDPENDRTV